MCQITVADWVEPMGSLLFLSPSRRHTYKLCGCGGRREQNCDQTFLQRRGVCACVCMCVYVCVCVLWLSTTLPWGLSTHRHHLIVCTPCEWALHYLSVWTLLFWWSYTQTTRQFKKGWHIGKKKKNQSIYKYMCIWNEKNALGLFKRFNVENKMKLFGGGRGFRCEYNCLWWRLQLKSCT